jgi:hypothetical protein
MNEPGHTPALLIVVIAGLVLWRLYSRVRRTVGRQQLTPTRPRVVVVLYPLIGALLVFAAGMQPLALGALLGGVAVGVGLGVYGLRLTRYEVAPDGQLYYTPNVHIGIGLTALLVGRILYRLAFAPGFGVPDSTGAAPMPAVPPLTLLFFGPLLGYYTTYFIGLLRWRTSVLESRTALSQPPL